MFFYHVLITQTHPAVSCALLLSAFASQKKLKREGKEKDRLQLSTSSLIQMEGNACQWMGIERLDGQFIVKQITRGGCLHIIQGGGYHVTYSAYCLHATLDSVLDLLQLLLCDPIAHYSEDEAFSVEVVGAIRKYHKDLVPFLIYDSYAHILLKLRHATMETTSSFKMN